MFFTILDFRNATKLFADPNFNGPEEQDEDYDPNKPRKPKDDDPIEPVDPVDPPQDKKKKIYIDGVEVQVLSERVQYYDKDGKLVTESLKDYTRRNMLSEYATLDDFLQFWTSSAKRSAIIDELFEHGVLIEALRELYPADVDDFDLLCDIAYGIKPLTKSERAKNNKVDEVLAKYSEKCRQVLQTLIDKYADDTIDELVDKNNLKLKEFNEFGSPMKIASLFGGQASFLSAVREVQNALYA